MLEATPPVSAFYGRRWKVSRWRLLYQDASIPCAGTCQVRDSRNDCDPRKAIRECGVSQSCCEQSVIAYLRRAILGPCPACIARAHVALQRRRRRPNSSETESLRVCAESLFRTARPLYPILVPPALLIARETIDRKGFVCRIQTLA